jgi:phage-related minor tail protein
MTTRQVGIRLNTEGKAEVKRDFTEVATAGQQAGKDIGGAFDAAAVTAKKAEDAATRQMAKYKEMAKAAREYETQQEHQAKFNAILGVNGGGEKSARDSAEAFSAGGKGMTRQQRAGVTNLFRQGADILTSATGGASADTILFQQGPQILDAVATSGFKASGAMIALGVGVTATAGAVVALAVAQAQYEAETVKMTVATQGLGAASGVTADQLAASADAGAKAGEMSVRAAREAGIAYVQTGRISGQVLDDLIGLTQRYALTTSQDATAATKELGAAFADPAKGAADLNDKLHFLDASELRHIENLARAGREAEAQAILVDKLEGSLLAASAATTGWGHALEGLGRIASNTWDAVGRAVDRAMTGGDDAQRLADLRAAKAKEQRKMFGGSDHLITEFDREIAEINRRYAAEQVRLKAAGLSQRSVDRQKLVDQYNPNDTKLAGLKADREKLVGLGVNDAASKAALKELDSQINALGAGYKTAAQQAAALARAQRKASSDAAKGVREQAKEAREAAEAERKAQELKTQGLRGQLDIAKALNDPSAIDYAERQLRIQQLIVSATRDGVRWAVAWRDANKQVAAEMEAEFAAVQKAYSDAELAKDQFVSSSERVSKALSGADIVPYTATTAFIEDLRVNSGEALHDGLMAGMTGGDFFDVFTDRLKYAAASALADSITNAAFGKKDGSKSGWIDTAVNAAAHYFGANANGTDNWRGGLTWVGEEGAELIDLPKGSKVYDHQSSVAMAAANDRAAMQARSAITGGGNGPVSVSATFAPVLTVTGGDSEEIGRLRAQLAAMEANFQSRVTAAVNDGLARRTIKVA